MDSKNNKAYNRRPDSETDERCVSLRYERLLRMCKEFFQNYYREAQEGLGAVQYGTVISLHGVSEENNTDDSVKPTSLVPSKLSVVINMEPVNNKDNVYNRRPDIETGERCVSLRYERLLRLCKEFFWNYYREAQDGLNAAQYGTVITLHGEREENNADDSVKPTRKDKQHEE